ncbi:MAG: effector-associated constant component EACC1 [Planctomycetota bacterium]|jgi:hypothetical protein
MELNLELNGADANEQSILGLQDWIRKERISGVQVERKTAPPVKGEMGVEPLTILSVVLGSAAVIELVKSIHVWLTVRRPKLKISLKVGQSEVEIDAINLPEQERFVEKVLEKLKPVED